MIFLSTDDWLRDFQLLFFVHCSFRVKQDAEFSPSPWWTMRCSVCGDGVKHSRGQQSFCTGLPLIFLRAQMIYWRTSGSCSRSITLGFADNSDFSTDVIFNRGIWDAFILAYKMWDSSFSSWPVASFHIIPQCDGIHWRAKCLPAFCSCEVSLQHFFVPMVYDFRIALLAALKSVRITALLNLAT